MAKEIYVAVDGKARRATALYVGVDGRARRVKKVYVGVDRKARLAWEDDPWPDALREFSGTLSVSYTHSRWGDTRSATAEVWFVREGNVWSGTAELMLNGVVASVESVTLALNAAQYKLGVEFSRAEICGIDNSFFLYSPGPIESTGNPCFQLYDSGNFEAVQVLNSTGVPTIRLTPFTD